LRWLPDGNTLATGWLDGGLELWDTRSGDTLFSQAPERPSATTLPPNSGPMLLDGPAAAVSPDGRRAALFTKEAGQLGIQIWDIRAGRRLFRCQPVTTPQQWDLTWSLDGKYLAACGSDHGQTRIHYWDASNGELSRTDSALAWPEQLTWSPDRHFLALVDKHPYFRVPTDAVLRIFSVG
jgi:WD40 repeat protein